MCPTDSTNNMQVLHQLLILLWRELQGFFMNWDDYALTQRPAVDRQVKDQWLL